MLQYKIPQNVQLEDKILYFLTMKQLIICGIGGGIAYTLYIGLAPTYYIEVWGLPVLLISLLTVAIAFLKINNISFTRYVLLALEFTINPQKRRWNNRQTLKPILAAMLVDDSKKKKELAQNTNEKEQLPYSLSDLVKKLDHNPFEKKEESHPMDEVTDDHLVAHGVLGEDHDVSDHEKRLDTLMKEQLEQPKKEPEKIGKEELSIKKEEEVEVVPDSLEDLFHESKQQTEKILDLRKKEEKIRPKTVVSKPKKDSEIVIKTKEVTNSLDKKKKEEQEVKKNVQEKRKQIQKKTTEIVSVAEKTGTRSLQKEDLQKKREAYLKKRKRAQKGGSIKKQSVSPPHMPKDRFLKNIDTTIRPKQKRPNPLTIETQKSEKLKQLPKNSIDLSQKENGISGEFLF